MFWQLPNNKFTDEVHKEFKMFCQTILHDSQTSMGCMTMPNNILDYGGEYGQKKTTPFGVVGL
jgi:hypothetical protein